MVANEADFTFPLTTNTEDGGWWYEFQLTDQGVHTIEKWFIIKKTGNYEIDFIDIRLPPSGLIKTIKIKVTN